MRPTQSLRTHVLHSLNKNSIGNSCMKSVSCKLLVRCLLERHFVMISTCQLTQESLNDKINLYIKLHSYIEQEKKRERALANN